VAGSPDGRPSPAEDATAEAVERARKAVTNRIGQTVTRIATVHQALGITNNGFSLVSNGNGAILRI